LTFTPTATNAYDYEIQDMKGYTNNFQLFWVQIISTSSRWNATSNTNLATTLTGNGLDNGGSSFPYYVHSWPISPASFPSGTNGYWDDSPGFGLNGSGAYYWRTDNFQTYLLFQPNGGKPVPLKQANWNWSGQARLTDITSSPPTYELVSPINPSATIGSPCSVPPTWTNNLFPLVVSTTNSWYPTP
jgi:hypothetical protein